VAPDGTEADEDRARQQAPDAPALASASEQSPGPDADVASAAATQTLEPVDAWAPDAPDDPDATQAPPVQPSALAEPGFGGEVPGALLAGLLPQLAGLLARPGEEAPPAAGTETPLEPLVPRPDSLEAAAVLDDELALPPSVAAQAVVSLLAGSDLLLAGPPNSGRGPLLRRLAELVFGCTAREHAPGGPPPPANSVLIVSEVTAGAPPRRPSGGRVLYTTTAGSGAEAWALSAALPGQPVVMSLWEGPDLEREERCALRLAAGRCGVPRGDLQGAAQGLLRCWRLLRAHGALGTGLLVRSLTRLGLVCAEGAELGLTVEQAVGPLLVSELGPALCRWPVAALLSASAQAVASGGLPASLADILGEVLLARAGS